MTAVLRQLVVKWAAHHYPVTVCRMLTQVVGGVTMVLSHRVSPVLTSLLILQADWRGIFTLTVHQQPDMVSACIDHAFAFVNSIFGMFDIVSQVHNKLVCYLEQKSDCALSSVHPCIPNSLAP